MIRFSIVIPLYNRVGLIEETIRSLLKQTYAQFEIRVIDDGSTDGSEQVVLSLQKQDNRVYYSKRTGSVKGANTCRNQGIEASTGEYIVLLDSDDLLAPYCLEQRRQEILRQPDFDCWIFPMLLFTKSPGDSMVLQNIETGENYLDRFLGMDLPWLISSPVWRKQKLVEIGKLDEEIPGYQDAELHVRALMADVKTSVRLDAVPDHFYRMHAQGTISSERKDERYLEVLLLLQQRFAEKLRSRNTLTRGRKKIIASNLTWIAYQYRHYSKGRVKEVRKKSYEIWNLASQLHVIRSFPCSLGRMYTWFTYFPLYYRWRLFRISVRFIFEKWLLRSVYAKKPSHIGKHVYTGRLEYFQTNRD
ncbi:MAG: glycosyltransferase family 2 protein [Flavobacteriales bacterium]